MTPDNNTPSKLEFEQYLHGLDVVDAEVLERRDQDERRKELRDVWRRVPSLLRQELHHNPRGDRLTDIVSEWGPDYRNYLLLGGGYARLAAAALVRRLLNTAVEKGGEDLKLAHGIYWHQAATVSKARNNVDGHALLRECVGARVLVLDMLECQALDNVLDVLHDRKDKLLPTVITSTLPAQQFLTRQGEELLEEYMLYGYRKGWVDMAEALGE